MACRKDIRINVQVRYKTTHFLPFSISLTWRGRGRERGREREREN